MPRLARARRRDSAAEDGSWAASVRSVLLPRPILAPLENLPGAGAFKRLEPLTCRFAAWAKTLKLFDNLEERLISNPFQTNRLAGPAAERSGGAWAGHLGKPNQELDNHDITLYPRRAARDHRHELRCQPRAAARDRLRGPGGVELEVPDLARDSRPPVAASLAVLRATSKVDRP